MSPPSVNDADSGDNERGKEGGIGVLRRERGKEVRRERRRNNNRGSVEKRAGEKICLRLQTSLLADVQRIG